MTSKSALVELKITAFPCTLYLLHNINKPTIASKTAYPSTHNHQDIKAVLKQFV